MILKKENIILILLKNNKSNFENMAIIAASIDYITKLEKLQPNKPTQNLGNSWKDFGRKRSILRLWK